MSVAPFTSSKLKSILIIDDNPSFTDFLHAILSGYLKNSSDIYTANSPSEANRICNEKNPSMVFVDAGSVSLQDECVVNNIKSESTDVVFTLDADSSSIPAFQLSGTSFLTKPFLIEEVINVMEKISPKEQLKNQTTPHQPHTLERLTLKSQEGVTCLNLSNIRRLESDSNYTHFFLKSGEKITIPKTLKEYENILPKSNFFRTHQSHIVNLSLVKKFLKEDGGYALMDDGTQVLVSRRKKNGFLRALTA